MKVHAREKSVAYVKVVSTRSRIVGMMSGFMGSFVHEICRKQWHFLVVKFGRREACETNFCAAGVRCCVVVLL